MAAVMSCENALLGNEMWLWWVNRSSPPPEGRLSSKTKGALGKSYSKIKICRITDKSLQPLPYFAVTH